MIVSADVRQLFRQRRTGLTSRKVRGDAASTIASPGGSYDAVPQRYRDGRGGINVQTVEQDRRRVRQRLIRAMFRRLVGGR